MSDDERKDLLELKVSIERHLLTLHDEIINLIPHGGRSLLQYVDTEGAILSYHSGTNQSAINRRIYMNNARKKIMDHLAQVEQATTPAERSSTYRDMIKYHHFLSAEDRAATNDLIKPYLDEIAKINLSADPLMDRANEQLNRIRTQYVSQP